MPRDNKLKTMPKESSKKMKKLDEMVRRRKNNDTSDSDSWDSNASSENSDSEVENEVK